jgi:hypothetical protein
MFTQMKSRWVKLVLATFFIVTIVGLVATMRTARSTTMLPRCSSETDYYSDATLTTQVGEKFIYCNGQVITNGTITSFKQAFITGACSSGSEEECGPVNP